MSFHFHVNVAFIGEKWIPEAWNESLCLDSVNFQNQSEFPLPVEKAFSLVPETSL